MEGFLDALGTVVLIGLVLIGLAAGWIASMLAGGHTARYLALGVAGALALPFVLALLGLGVLAAGGALAILLAALIGAVIVLLVARALFD